MPASAIATGLVDLVVPVEQIGPKLEQYARSLRSLDPIVEDRQTLRRDQAFAGAIQEIYAILRKRVGHDFAGYKEKTFMRRVQRRMQVLQIGSLGLRRAAAPGPDEAMLLFRDLLIGVTSFFRDAEAFEVIEGTVIPSLFENVGAADTVRVWVPGCATGEEAYSIAILLREHMDKIERVPRVQVFATDIDEPGALGRAQRPLSRADARECVARAAQALLPSRRRVYVLTKEVRDLCIFSAHSVIRDPPFSRMDLVSCRNLLIYFDAELQDSVLPVFHYALKPGGYLFLGPSETVSRHGDLFTPVDKKHRVFQRRPDADQ